ncbi:hypothetical protein FRC02_008138 [Tulasnella sp. 418]|nr:hypothetical protein FRC02_008138 [Tulasnella sp. 418]
MKASSLEVSSIPLKHEKSRMTANDHSADIPTTSVTNRSLTSVPDGMYSCCCSDSEDDDTQAGDYTCKTAPIHPAEEISSQGNFRRDKGANVHHQYEGVMGPGLMVDDVYTSQMAWWRAAIRRALVRNLLTESKWLAAMQERIRSPFMDRYFVYTSSLGTHTFFMTMLPALFFFGHEEVGRGLVNVIGIGVYLSSLVKDSICSPRPFAPPVTRLTVGTHHLEYGFPSTHSTNSVSIALFFHGLAQELFVREAISRFTLVFAQIALAWYTISIVFGRLYCAMHSFTDCAMGVILGTMIWAAQSHWAQDLEKWLASEGFHVPLVTIIVGAFMINQHAEPVDDCPCFEDAIAFISVLMGCFLSKWWAMRWGYDKSSGFFTQSMPQEWASWCAIATAKMIVGVFIIFTWRIMAKRILHIVLPPLFRLLSTLFTLPNRRFYTPATDYERVPDDKSLLQHPFPSVIDLPGLSMEEDGVVIGKGTALLPRVRSNGDAAAGGPKLRAGAGTIAEQGRMKGGEVIAMGRLKDIPREKVTHYDADVLTKVIVYSGIAFLATGVIPVMFESLGWGVYTFA